MDVAVPIIYQNYIQITTRNFLVIFYFLREYSQNQYKLKSHLVELVMNINYQTVIQWKSQKSRIPNQLEPSK